MSVHLQGPIFMHLSSHLCTTIKNTIVTNKIVNILTYRPQNDSLDVISLFLARNSSTSKNIFISGSELHSSKFKIQIYIFSLLKTVWYKNRKGFSLVSFAVTFVRFLRCLKISFG